MQVIISAILRKGGYDVEVASDGEEAWNILREKDIRLVVSDWLMPNLDGLELARRIREANFDSYVYFILLTAKDQKSDLVEGMEAGADDFLTKPVNKEELLVRIRAGVRILDLEMRLEERNRKLAEANDNLSRAYETIEKDLQSAATMQKALLPEPSTLSGVRFDWLYLPSSYVAGDMFGYFPLDEDMVGFYQLDVAGHGIPASLLSFTLNKVLLPDVGETGIVKGKTSEPPYYEVVAPDEVAAELNRRFQGEGDMAMQYFTMVYGIFDKKHRRLTFCQAGHPHPLYLDLQEGSVQKVGDAGVPVGMLPGVQYESINLVTGSKGRLFLYSDGITECENAEGEQFSEQRLLELLYDNRNLPLDEVTAMVGNVLKDWNGDDNYQDDVTLLALEWDLD
jgi:sigma-B regulation protein RsbU (phosphoserine phosphatase)